MAERFDVADVIRVKRDGGELSPEEIAQVIDAYTRGVVGDEQVAALNMAIFIRDMNRQEIVDWTQAMIGSGETMSFASLSKPTTDKYSTGGVGGKVTLPLGPLASFYGVAVPQLSGRGLGHTGGTLDKLESILGWQADVPNDRLVQILENSGAVVVVAGTGLAPADKKIYALCDVTSTAGYIPLIASSIMSKKIAEGASNLVLDVRVGSGAFMKDLDQARELICTMVDLGNDAGVNTRTLLMDMSTPSGPTIDNTLKIRESVEVPAGNGPADVVELTCELVRSMLELVGVHDADVEQALKDGRAMDSQKKMIRAQGDDPDAALPVVSRTHDVVVQTGDYPTKLDALALGVSSWCLGAGRVHKEDPVQATAGIEIFAKPGDKVVKGQKLFTLHTETPDKFEHALESIEPGIEIGDTVSTAQREVILDRVSQKTSDGPAPAPLPRPEPAISLLLSSLPNFRKDLISLMTSRADVAKMIDYTLLKPGTTSDQVKAFINEAAKLGTYSICISPSRLPVEVPEGLHIATVVGFPSGAVRAEVKAAEAARAVADGVEEVDMVINIAFAREHRFNDLEAEIRAVRDAIPGRILKVIIESAALADGEIIAACKVSESAGADFVKTSTGLYPAGGTSAHVVKLMRETVGDRLGVKTSGGIRDAAAAEGMVAADVSRLGLLSSAAVLDGLKQANPDAL